MIFYYNVNVGALKNLFEQNLVAITDYWTCKSFKGYFLLFIPSLITSLFFLPFLLCYGLILSFVYVKDLDDLVYTDNTLLKFITLTFIYIFIIFWSFVSLAFSLPVYILCWITGIFAKPLNKALEALGIDGNGYLTEGRFMEIKAMIKEYEEELASENEENNKDDEPTD